MVCLFKLCLCSLTHSCSFLHLIRHLSVWFITLFTHLVPSWHPSRCETTSVESVWFQTHMVRSHWPQITSILKCTRLGPPSTEGKLHESKIPSPCHPVSCKDIHFSICAASNSGPTCSFTFLPCDFRTEYPDVWILMQLSKPPLALQPRDGTDAFTRTAGNLSLDWSTCTILFKRNLLVNLLACQQHVSIATD